MICFIVDACMDVLEKFMHWVVPGVLRDACHSATGCVSGDPSATTAGSGIHINRPQQGPRRRPSYRLARNGAWLVGKPRDAQINRKSVFHRYDEIGAGATSSTAITIPISFGCSGK